MTVKAWDGSAVDTARLEGVLTANEQGCVSVDGTVVAWPNTYRLVVGPNDQFTITNQDGTILGTEGQTVALSGGMSPHDQNGTSTVRVSHEGCLTGDYWTGVIGP